MHVVGPEPAPERPARKLRVVPPPAHEPPAQRDVAPVTAAAVTAATNPRSRRAAPRHVQAALPLLHVLPSGAPAAPRPQHRLRVVAPPVTTPAGGPMNHEDLPDPRSWSARLVQATVEAQLGDRPWAQLVRWTTREVYEQLVRAQPPSTRPAGTRARRRTVRPVLRSLHLSEPAEGVVEACAVIDDGTRSRAVALRLEAQDGRWVCTALELR